MTSEFRRVTMNGPWVCGTSAAVYTTYPANVSILKRGTILVGSGSTGIGYITKCNGTNCTYSNSGDDIDYSTSQSAMSMLSSSCASGALSASNVFGMSLADLKKLADVSGSTVAEMYNTTSTPRVLADDKLFFLDGGGSTTFVFDDLNQFKGSGVFVVDGSLDVQNSGAHQRTFSGLIYVTQNTIFENYTALTGALISLGTVQISSTSCTDASEIDFSLAALNDARQNVLNFREDQSAVRIFTGIAQR
jgi:hypothetical protein